MKEEIEELSEEEAPLEAEEAEETEAIGEAEEEAEKAEAEEPERPRWQPIVAKGRIPIAIATVLLEAAVFARLGFHWSTLPVAAFASTAVALAVIDFAILRLPNALTEPTALAVVATLVLQALADGKPHKLVTEIEGAFGVAVFYMLLYALSRGGLGIGDVKVGAVAGLVLASRDWIHVFDGTFLAYIITLVVALAMMTRGRKLFPYGPGLMAGAIAVLLLAP